MARIHVCPLVHVEDVLNASGSGSVISLLSPKHPIPVLSGKRHLHVPVSDITTATPDHVLAEARHVEELIAFILGWDRRDPLLIHCYAGVSRSTATAFIALCVLDPERPESEHAETVRAASPTASPNPHLVALADAMLGRGGRMKSAVAAIGRGTDCFEGNCFALDVPDAAGSTLATPMS